ncbi:MAG: S9 family peptidase [Chloroflexi bacterium]|nr:S9 family peptidase [Chloroflexota bacterium]
MKPLTIAEGLKFKTLDSVAFSPDGQRIVFTAGYRWKWNAQEGERHIWMSDVAKGQTAPFTQGSQVDKAPIWSPDGNWLAFLSDRAARGKFQIYVMPTRGGEARRLTDLPDAPSDLHWSPDSRAITFLRTVPTSASEAERLKQGNDAIIFDTHLKPRQIWEIRLDANDPYPILTPEVQIWEYAPSPDGQTFALVCSDTAFEGSWFRSKLWLGHRKDAGAGTSQELALMYDPGDRQIAAPVWSPDGRWIAFLCSTWSDRGAIGGDLYLVSAQRESTEPTVYCLTPEFQGSMSQANWLPDSQSLIGIAWLQGEQGIVHIPWDGSSSKSPQILWQGMAGFSPRTTPALSISPDSRIFAAVREDPATPPEVWSGTLGQHIQWRQVSHVQPPLDYDLGQAESITWTSHDGLKIQGYVIYPPEYTAGRPHPLVTVVHGGPSSAHAARFSPIQDWAAYLAARGLVVFMPNPRGSVGWGVASTESNLGDMGGQDLQDILTGIDFLVSQGVADTNRLGIAGWSYGGYMAAWAITQDQRFKAAVVGAGITDWRAFHNEADIPDWAELFLLANPYHQPEVYERWSPINYVSAVQTATLILHGEQDKEVPVGQAIAFYRALKFLGVETQMVIYPRAGHPVLERPHLEDMLNRLVDWLSRHLTLGGFDS